MQQGTTPLSLYLHHEHSKVLLYGVLPFKANDGTWERSKPLVMELSAPYVQSSLLIRRCPRQKCLGLLVHVSTREDAFPKPCLFSTTQPCHTHIMGNRQQDDQFKAWDSYISPLTQRP